MLSTFFFLWDRGLNSELHANKAGHISSPVLPTPSTPPVNWLLDQEPDTLQVMMCTNCVPDPKCLGPEVFQISKSFRFLQYFRRLYQIRQPNLEF
jgi:hypothetical protein